MTALYYLLGFLCGFAAAYLLSLILHSRSRNINHLSVEEGTFLGIICD